MNQANYSRICALAFFLFPDYTPEQVASFTESCLALIQYYEENPDKFGSHAWYRHYTSAAILKMLLVEA